MAFGDDHFETLLPPYLTSSDKDRLKEALSQFFKEQGGQEIDYSRFYETYLHSYFKQGDIVVDLRRPVWDEEHEVFEKEYLNALLLSNTCDLSSENVRNTNPKQCIAAPVLPLADYLADLQAAGRSASEVRSFEDQIRKQRITNLFFLPSHGQETVESIALLDQLFWLSTAELNALLPSMKEELVASMSHFGFYLLVLKVSYHFCRLPETCDREVDAPSL